MSIDKEHYVTYREIITQGQALEAILDRLEKFPLDLRSYQELAFVGCGSSLFLSQFIARAWSQRLGIRAQAVPASEVILHPAVYFHPGRSTLVFPFSRTGETTETIRAARKLREDYGFPILPVTCYRNSQLASLSSSVLEFPEVPEESIVMTRAFTGILGAFLHWGRGEAQLAKIPSWISASLQENESSLADLAAVPYRNVVFLGTGTLYDVACEAMLKLKEMTGQPAEAWQTFEFRHGPRAILEEGTLAWVFASREEFPYLADIVDEFQSLKAQICLVGNRLPAALRNRVEYCFDFDWALERSESEALGMLHLPQLYAFFRALHLGKNPDRPDKLSRVVRL